MLLLVKAIALAVSLWPSLTSAAPCTGGSCLEDHDEVSFVQVKQVVKERRPAHKKTEKKTEKKTHKKTEKKTQEKTDSDVVDAYEKNLKKVEPTIAKTTASDLAFEDKVNKAQRHSVEKAEAALAKDRKAVRDAIKKQEAAVEKVAAHRRKVEKEAQAKIDHAAADAEARDEKLRQVEYADAAGRLEGAREGRDKARREVRAQWENKRKDRMVAERKAAKKHAKAAKKHAAQIINDATKRMEKENKAWVHNAAVQGDREIDGVKARAHAEEERIEGEGIKDLLDKNHADRMARHYQRDVDADDKIIKKAKDAKWVG